MARRISPGYMAVVTGMASYVDAAAITGFAVALTMLQPILGLAPIDIGIASGTLTLGIAAGALIGGRLGDRWGRRPVFVATMVGCVAASTVMLLIPPFPVLLCAAALLGIATGADLPVALTTASEMAPERIRARLILVSNLLWVAGIVANLLISSAVGDLGVTGIRIIFGHIGLMSLLVLIARLTIPESWRWLAASRTTASSTAARPGVRSITRAPYARHFWAIAGFYTLTNLVANTNGQLGIYVMVNFAGATVPEAARVVLLGVPIVVVGLVIFMRFADGPARFRLFTAGAVVGVIAPLVLAVFGVTLTTYTIATVCAAVGIAFAFEGMMKIWTQESFPPLLRSTAQGSVIALARATAAAFAIWTPVFLEYNITAFYLFLACLQFAGVAIAWLAFHRHPFGSSFALEATDAPVRDGAD